METKKAVEKLEKPMKKILKIVEKLREVFQTKSGTSIAKIQRNLLLLRDDMRWLMELNTEVKKALNEIKWEKIDSMISGVVHKNGEFTRGNKKDLDMINRKIFSLVCQVPVLPNKRKKAKALDSEDGDGDNHGKLIECSSLEQEADDDLRKVIWYIHKYEKLFQEHEAYLKQSLERIDMSCRDKSNTDTFIPTMATELSTTWLVLGSIMVFFSRLPRSLRFLQNELRKLQEFNADIAEELNLLCLTLDNLLYQARYGWTQADKKELEKINSKIFNLMCQVPLVPNKPRKDNGFDSEDYNKVNRGKLIECLPGIHTDEEDFKRLAVFKYVKTTFMELDDVKKKIYLLSFALFPENQEVNQTMLMYWWIGEGILDYKVTSPKNGSVLDEKDRPENVVKEILKEFTEKKLIEPVDNRRKVEPNSYKMTPFVHASVVQISIEMKLFDIYRKGKKPTMNLSEMNKICLVEGSSSQDLAKANKMTKADQIETVFNVSERFPDFTFKWFSEDQSSAKKKYGPLSKTTYKGLKVFYLGRWERTAKRHIQVENPELMKNLKHMTKLKLLSFQGISRIERLDDAICKLRDLIILDLRACYNLEKLPEKIDSLKALTYLDITECYIIDHMPKKLSWLNNLEVLKGFVIGDATEEETVCTLADLKYLKKLRKLTVAINKEVSVEKLFMDVQDFNSLEKLKLAWGSINGNTKEKGTTEKNKPIELPKNLKKLDLQCFPAVELPTWLRPDVLDKLEKLYIKGGTKLTGFGMSRPDEPTKCKVKILRLKFLPRLKVEWMELHQLYFPRLEFLEKYQCPQVSFCPTDGLGIWRKGRL